MPNGHLVHPVLTRDAVVAGLATFSDFMVQVNAATFLPVFLWTLLGVTVLVGAIALVRAHS